MWSLRIIKCKPLFQCFPQGTTVLIVLQEYALILQRTPYPVNTDRGLLKDTILPVVLITAIDSELPSSSVHAQLEKDIYAETGDLILLPRGSKLFGSYLPITERGQTRMQIVWNEIRYYNEKEQGVIRVKLPDSETTDAIGRSGTTGELDTRLAERINSSLLISAINAVSQIAIPYDTNDPRYIALANSASQTLGSVAAEELRANSNIPPKLRIPGGSRLNVMTNADIWFKPPKNNIIEVEEADFSNSIALKH